MSDALEQAYAGARRVLGEYLSAPPDRRHALIAQLRPRATDYAAVFDPEHAAESASRGYIQLWGNQPVWPVPPEPGVEIYCAPADAFTAQTPTRETQPFPGGYHEIACWLRKGVVWAAWTFTSMARLGGALFDGLVEVEPGRWAWFPRPWKVLPKPPGPTLWWDD
jgi:hypothetical protein